MLNRHPRNTLLGSFLIVAALGCSDDGLDDGPASSDEAAETSGTESSTTGEDTSGTDSTSTTDAGESTETADSTETSESSSEESSSADTRGCDALGFHVDGGTLYDANCNAFVIRGINYPYAWYSWRDDTADQFAAMAAAGANAVRIVLTNGAQWERVSGDEVAQVIGWARDNDMVAILEVHDATGWSEQASAAPPSTAVDYWLSDDVRAAIEGSEDHVLINIANEPMGNTTTEEWMPFHVGAIGDLRSAGIHHTLIVDAPNWGQDWTGTMRDGVQAQSIFAADPDANVMFSVHMYEVYDEDAKVESYVADFLGSGLALLVGEFAADHGGPQVAAEAIMATAEASGVGYLGWSWSGNSAELASLDMVVDFSGQLTPWGQLLVDGPNGLQATAQTCSCFE